MPGKRPSVKNEKQYEALKRKGMSKERAARIANSPGALQQRRQEVRIRRQIVLLLAGWHDRAEEGGGAQGRQGHGPQAQLVWPGPASVTPSPYGWPVIERTRADRGEP